MVLDVKEIIKINNEVSLQLPSINTELVIKCRIQYHEPIVEAFTSEVIDITDIVEDQDIGMEIADNASKEPTHHNSNNNPINNISHIDPESISKTESNPSSPNDINLIKKIKPSLKPTSTTTNIKTKTNQPYQSFLKINDKTNDISKETKRINNRETINVITPNLNRLVPSFRLDENKQSNSPMRSPICLNQIKHSHTGKTKPIASTSSPIIHNSKTKHFYLNTGAESEIVLRTIPNTINRSYEILEDYLVQDNNDTISEFNPTDNLFPLDPIKIETFCIAIFISGVSKSAEIIPNSNTYPAICSHKECSIFSSFKPSVLSKYQNDKKYQLEINDLPHLCFPVGIKLCYMTDEEQYPLPHKSFMNIIKNEKGVFYVMTIFYYKKISTSVYDKEYLQNPIKEYVKFQDVVDSSSVFNEKEFNDKLQIVSQFIEKDEIYIPESISLISRYPYFDQMEICLNKLILLPLIEKKSSLVL